MDFISWQFIFFFVLAMLILLPCYKNKKIFLSIFNILFCIISGGIVSLLVIIAYAVISYTIGKYLYKYRSKYILLMGIIVSLCPLICLKSTILLRYDINFIVPLGISYYLLQGISYLVDIYNNKCEIQHSFIDYFTYLSLFTCIIAGPINRANKILEQLCEYDNTSFEYRRCVEGLQYVLLGIFLKLFLAGRMAEVVNKPYANIDSTGGMVLLISSICYTIYIFADFCGYSYMAFGLSKVIGIDVVMNFNMPYRAMTITEFWRRWHISLSSWLTEYIYIPLGGNRCSKLKSSLNVLVTFAISGLWHGVTGSYIVWGMLNGMFIIIERLIGAAKYTQSKVSSFVHWLITIMLINVMWIFFRASSLQDAIKIIYKIVVETASDFCSVLSKTGMINMMSQMGLTMYELGMVILAGIFFVIFEVTADLKERPIQIFERNNVIVRWLMYIIIITVSLTFGVSGKASEFIYAQF